MNSHQPLPDGWSWEKLETMCVEDRKIVDPQSKKASQLKYLSLENIESNTGRILSSNQPALENEVQSNTFEFSSKHVLYGKLRPYLNKVALPDFDGRCTTELIPLLPNELIEREYLALVLRRKETVAAAMEGVTGSRMPRANMAELFRLQIPLPPPLEQKRIVAILNEKLTAVEAARKAATAQLKAARALPAAYLREVFEGEKAKKWKWGKLGEVSELLPAKSIANAGDAEVTAITTACLTESGFDPVGLKQAIMWAKDVPECIVSKGEILIARSNTPQLVGRVSLYDGNPPGIVASDLTIRVWPSPVDFYPSFLASYLSFLFLTGYWQERAGGASGSMKKITRAQVLNVDVPVPPKPEQEVIVSQLNEKMDTARELVFSLQKQREGIEKIPAAMLRQAFNGEL